MRQIRLITLVIAAMILLDFLIICRARHELAITVAPALAGAIVTVFVSWRDAASPAQRRLLAGCTCLLAAGLGAGLLVSLCFRSPFQVTFMSILFASTLTLSWRAISQSRKRRQLHGMAHYLES